MSSTTDIGVEKKNPATSQAVSSSPTSIAEYIDFDSTNPTIDASDDSVKKPKYFHSRRVRKEDIERPWLLDPPDPKEKWLTLMPLIGAWLGAIISGFMIWDGWRKGMAHSHYYCLAFADDFQNGFDRSIWSPEIATGGFGTGSFDMTTDFEENIFVDQDGSLNIMPTLQDEDLITTNRSRVEFGPECTAKDPFYCSAQTWSNGTIVPPVKSARITTRDYSLGAIRYGKVEIVAKLPKGDWLWPAIWMMPLDAVYGDWPRSGEMDIVESRGNDHTYPDGGNNLIHSTLHWGPDGAADAWYQTYKKHSMRHTTFSQGFNNFTLEWSQKYLFTYLNSRLMQVIYVPFDKPMWGRGNFGAQQDKNNTAFSNPWAGASVNAPFDQKFYLILNVAVGSTNGWFKDGDSHKPWVDGSPTAPMEFWRARDEWYPTWTQPAMQVKSVKMWQQCDPEDVREV